MASSSFSGTRPYRVAAFAGLVVVGSTAAQVPVMISGGALRGFVVDSVSGQPIPHALVSYADQRFFAGPNGHFVVRGVRTGPGTLTVAQIGYGARTLALQIQPDTSATSVELRVALIRQPLVLPELNVTASLGCARGTIPGTGDLDPAILAVLENAERLLVLEHTYPFESTFIFQSKEYDAQEKLISANGGSLRIRTKSMKGYQPGRVLERSGRVVNYFTISDLARPTFRQTHCFWHASIDTLNGQETHTIEFEPLAAATWPDWSGRLTVTAATSQLVQSSATLVNLDSTKTNLRSVRCTVVYGEVVATVFHEELAQCVLAEARKTDWTTTVETSRFGGVRFVGRKPGDP